MGASSKLCPGASCLPWAVRAGMVMELIRNASSLSVISLWSVEYGWRWVLCSGFTQRRGARSLVAGDWSAMLPSRRVRCECDPCVRGETESGAEPRGGAGGLSRLGGGWTLARREKCGRAVAAVRVRQKRVDERRPRTPGPRPHTLFGLRDPYTVVTPARSTAGTPPLLSALACHHANWAVAVVALGAPARQRLRVEAQARAWRRC